VPLLLLLVVGLLSGLNTQRAIARLGQDPEWRHSRRLGFTRAVGPSQPTLHRVLRQLDVAVLETVLGHWLQQVRAAWRHSAARWLDGIAIDGKTLRGARRLGASEAHLLSACCQRLGIVLGEIAVPDTTNEYGAVGALLDALLLGGETVTFDAAFTQWLVAEQTVQQGAAYLCVLKGNQPTLLADAQRATAWPARYLGQAQSIRLAHGRYEERTLVAADAGDLPWPHARQVLRLHHRFIAKRTGEVLSDAPLYAALTAFRNLAISLIHRYRGRDVTAAREYYGRHPAVLFRQLGLAPG
jgi:hypothetical protein